MASQVDIMENERMRKRHLAWLVELTFLLALCTTVQTRAQPEAAKKVPPALVVTLSPARVSADLSSTIVFEATVTNVSKAKHWWAASLNHYRDLSYTLTLNGKPVEKTKLLREVSSDPLPGEIFTEPTSVVSFPIPPGESARYTIKLNELYELTEPGNYQFVVRAYDNVSKKPVSSKPVIIEIRR
jgi:hypothetical protein